MIFNKRKRQFEKHSFVDLCVNVARIATEHPPIERKEHMRPLLKNFQEHMQNALQSENPELARVVALASEYYSLLDQSVHLSGVCVDKQLRLNRNDEDDLDLLDQIAQDKEQLTAMLEQMQMVQSDLWAYALHLDHKATKGTIF